LLKLAELGRKVNVKVLVGALDLFRRLPVRQERL
jgi:hypothetical protein